MRSVRGNLGIIESQRESKIGGNSEMSSRRLNMHFSIAKFKKLQQKSVALENL